MGKENTNETSKLINYVFLDGSHIRTNSKNKVLGISEDGIKYSSMKSFFSRYVRASAPDKNSWENCSTPPRVGEHLVSTRIFGFSPEVSIYPVTKISEQ